MAPTRWLAFDVDSGSLDSRTVLRTCVALVGFACAGCGSEDDPRPTSWGYIHAAIIAPSCATVGCHSDVSRQRDLSLEHAETARSSLLDRRHVFPGDEASPLMFQLRGEQRTRMPPDAPLPALDVELIRRWIVDGARP
jgi:hypothetical protein